MIPQRALLLCLGTIFFGLGALGAVLPLLPTTPLLLLAAACYAKSSRRAHAWLLGTRVFGPVILRWQESRTISVRTKLVSSALLILTLGTTIAFFTRPAWLQVALAVLGVAVLILLLSLPVGTRRVDH